MSKNLAATAAFFFASACLAQSTVGALDACFYVWTLAGRYFSASADVPGMPVRSIQYVKSESVVSAG